MTFKPYPQQRAVMDHFRDPRSGSLIVEACAGAGKSTTVLEAVLASSDQTTLICAFNTRIKDDLEAKFSTREIPARRMIDVRTLHSLGMKLVGSHWHGVKIDKRATDELVKRHFSGHPRARFHVSRLVSHVKDVKPHLHTEKFAVDKAKEIVMAEVSDLKILEQPALVHQMAQAVVDVMEASLQRREALDFSDMIWVPVACDLQPRGRFQRVVVDEAQDMSLSQFELIERFVAPGGGLVVVGDLHQGIYEFRGADGAEIWKRMRERWNAKTLPLTVSFRCSQCVVEQAQELVPEIQWREDAPLGQVDEIEADELLEHVQPGDFVLSRANAPLVTLAIDLWLRGAMNPVIEGAREIAEPVLHILSKLSVSSIESYRASLSRWYNEQVERSTKDANATWTDRVDDWYELLSAVGERVGPARVKSVLESIFSISKEKKNSAADFCIDVDGPQYVSFSTVHKAKGLEARRVFLLKQSFWRYQDRGEDAPQEELNIEYVATTRAIEHLTWVNIDYEGPRSRKSRVSSNERKSTQQPHTKVQILGASGFVAATVEGPFDKAIEATLGAALDDIAMKHHAEVPDDDPRFMPESTPGIRVTIHDMQRFQSLTKPHDVVKGACRHCGLSAAYLMDPCSGPKPRTFPPAQTQSKSTPKRVFPPATTRKR